MPYLSVNRYAGFAKEATRGTAVTPDLWLPVDPNPSLEPDLKWLEDKALRGSPVEQYDDVPSVESSAYNFKGNVFADTFPVLLMGILGNSAVTGTAAPYTHTIGLTNDATTGSQPVSYTVTDVDNIAEPSTTAAKQFAAGQLSELTVDFAADAPVSYTAKYIGDVYSQVAVPSSPSFSTSVFMPAWNGEVTIGTVTSKVIVSGQISMKRSADPVYTIQAKQGPYRVWAGPLEVTGKVVLVAEAQDDTFNNALTRLQQSLTFKFTDPVSSHSVSFQMSAAQLKSPKVTSDKAWEEITADFTAMANTTDATDNGYAPIQTVTLNAQSSAY